MLPAMRRPLVLAALVFALALGVAAAQPVLHEYVPHASDDDLPDPITGGPSEEPAAILYEGEILPPPEGGARRPDERAMRGAPGDGEGPESPGRRSPTFRPDRVTALEGMLGYYTVFTPTIAPFKRVTALDAVVRAPAIDGGEPAPVLGLAAPRSAPVPLAGADAPPPDPRPRDRFWGSVVLDFSTGLRVPLPSVSPESRVLTLRSEPELALRVEKDGADNFFVVAPEGTRGEVRATFLMDAPRGYFNVAAIPSVPSDVYAHELFALEDSVRADALAFAAELGVAPGDPLDAVLGALTAHFRAFEESEEPPEETGNIYLDLARGMKGVCRHRAYGFVITAHALGVPARFVQNEAHAWVEVKIPMPVEGADEPVPGWLRVDLGGAASALQAHGAEDRPVYRPRERDPLPQPEAYRQSYSQLRGDVSGFRQDEEVGAASFASEGAGAGEGAGEAAPSEGTEAVAEEEGGALDALFDPPGEPEGPSARPLTLRLDRERFEVFRGRTLTVTGRATDPDGEGVEAMRVEVLLREMDAAGSRAASERLLGVTATRSGGAFQASVGVPPDLPVGDYRLIVRSPGDDRFFPATAR